MADNMEARDPDSGGAARGADHAHSGKQARASNSTTPPPLEPTAAIWCAWLAESDAKTGRVTKRPYRTACVCAKSNDPRTWIALDAAQRVAADPTFVNRAVDGLCGIGVMLGATSVPDAVLCGVDLDTCLDCVTGALTPWAQDVLDALPSYAEISPSRTGVKALFLLTPGDAARVQKAMGGPGRQWKLPGSDHPPGIELYLGGRYFALTGEVWPGAPDEIRMERADDVLRVVRQIGPSLKPDAGKTSAKAKPRAKANGAANGAHGEHEGDADDMTVKLEAFAKANAAARRLLSGDLSDLGADKSASAVAWRLAGFCKDAGLSQSDARAELRAYPHVDLLKYVEDQRQWARIWARVREEHATIDDADDDDRRSVADAIVVAAAPCIERLFRDVRAIAWATIRTEKRIDTMRVISRRFESHLRGAFYRAQKKTARGEALKQAAAHFETEALFSGEMDEARIRVAETEDAIFVDLADEEGRAVEITAGGWRVVDQSPVPFYRPNGMRALPIPERGGKLQDILKILNLKRPENDDADAVDSFVLLGAWLCAALRPRGPYPVLVLRGPPGSAKTTAAEIIRSLIDPAKPSTRNLPDTERDLFISTDAVHVVAIDNVSSISPAMSDALCRLATGGGYATRSLFTDGEEAIFEASRPTILNGLGAFVTRGDLQDRALTIELTPIEPSARRKKQEIDRDIDEARPGLLGALLDAVALGLKRAPDVKLTELPRMADFAHWAVACETAFANEGDFTKAWNRASENALPDDLAADPFAAAIIDLLGACPMEDDARTWAGSGKTLAAAINPEGKNRDLPKSGKGVSSAIERSRPLLGRAGVSVRRLPRTGTERPFELKLAEQSSEASQSSYANAANGLRRDDCNDDLNTAAAQSSQHDDRYDDLGEPPPQSSWQSSWHNPLDDKGNDDSDVRDDLSGPSRRDVHEGVL